MTDETLPPNLDVLAFGTGTTDQLVNFPLPTLTFSSMGVQAKSTENDRIWMAEEPSTLLGQSSAHSLQRQAVAILKKAGLTSEGIKA
ncbi:unnamed protein product [Protopolystoma xenopodis]|uniref:Uncharacterized protein n=1 Tax=Protopolystoma xenopodis TaxID=117903 RepID=A0A3S5ARD6_9PLAT|nr:unnamed protein product [Protopolystoma xenopodis]